MALDFKFIGSAVYTSTHSFFLSERAFYLITVDITKEPLSQLDLWVNSVKAKAPTAPIYIVATHIDHYAGDIMKALHQIEGFLNEREARAQRPGHPVAAVVERLLCRHCHVEKHAYPIRLNPVAQKATPHLEGPCDPRLPPHETHPYA
ncbi:hypothetical protein DFA_00687 [Cavenderia fasciculata]|uniref:Uncharacterized protein n=1 Tax=Cavenderia fasciculata TaxID=261658 RepID=F4PT86_CACFS|nr:uncharacterized protein DFA_00687 [Cavenderia fasciculata]EGG20822.1 hypothetical protein DFA_00687 [Cavenderia fasciculata]|eukprot:XP_004358672.1 hypothetical protein DFA_00687 [Cavenderia fasciculata]